MVRSTLHIKATNHAVSRQTGKVIKIAILVSVLLASSLAAMIVPSEFMIYILILIVAGAGGLILMHSPELGVILAIVGGINLPDVGPKNINVPIVMFFGLFILWLADMVVRQKRIHVVPSRTMVPLLTFLFVSLLAFGLGQFPWFRFTHNAPLDAQIGGLAVVVISAMAFIVTANLLKDVKWLEAGTWTVIALGGLYVLVRVIPGLHSVNQAVFQQQSLGGVFWGWFPVLAFSQMLINRDLDLRWRILFGLITLGALYVGIGQTYDWKSGWVPPLAGIAVIVALYSWRWGLILGALGAYPTFKILADSLISDDYSVSTRLEAWVILQEIVKVNPVLGLGFANYYWYTPLFPIRGFAVNFNSHNNFVDIVAQTGLAGLAMFLWLLVEIGLVGVRLLKCVPAGFQRAYVYGALGGLVATIAAGMLGDWVLPFVYNVGLSGMRTGLFAWIFLGGLVMLENLYLSKEKPG